VRASLSFSIKLCFCCLLTVYWNVKRDWKELSYII